MFALMAASGILVAHALAPTSPTSWAIACAAGSLVFLRHNNTATLCGFVALTFGFLHSVNVHAVSNFPHFRAIQNGQQFEATLTGVIADAPQQRNGVVTFPLKVDSFSDRYYRGTTSNRVSVVLFQASTIPHYGDHVRLRGRLSYPEEPQNPGQFDSRSWFQSQGVSAELIADGDTFAVLQRNQGNAIKSVAIQARESIRQKLTAGIEDDPDTASIVAAMVLGTKSDSPKELRNAFVNSGTMHVFAVSGLHIGIFGLIVWSFLRLTGMRRSTAILLIIPGILFYAFVTGLRPSACRAAIMGTILLSSFLVYRVPSLINSLGLAALVILASDTFQLMQVGFQLSFLVLGSIAVTAPPVHRFLHSLADPDPFLPRLLLNRPQRLGYFVSQKSADLATVSLSAWIGSTPLMLAHFEIATPIALIANCFLVPLAFAILFTSSVSLVSGSIWSFLSEVCNHTNWLLAKLSIFLATYFSQLPGGHSDHHNDQNVRVTSLRLNHGGSCLHVEVPDGEQWLIDTGHAKDFRRVIQPYFEHRGVNKIDTLVLSHNDAQHISGKNYVTQQFDPDRLIVASGIAPDFEISPTARVIFAPKAKQEFHLGGDVVLRVLYPPDEQTQPALADDNSLVLQLESGGQRILFTQDSGFLAERWLIENSRLLNSDILIMGRHRSDLCGQWDFIDAVSPDAIVVSSAEFPSHERLPLNWRRNLGNRGIRLMDQAEFGAIECVVEASHVTVQEAIR